jgi:hypothetical protein
MVNEVVYVHSDTKLPNFLHIVVIVVNVIA